MLRVDLGSLSPAPGGSPMRFRPLPSLLLMALALMAASAMWLMPDTAAGQVCNVKVVTDANPDYYDLPSMIRSITGKWSTPEEKCWAMFYWNHIARRQTSPMILHGAGVDRSDPAVQRLRLHDVQHDRGHQLRNLAPDGTAGQVLGHLAAHGSGVFLRRTLAHVRQLDVGHLHAVRRRDDRGRRGHRQGRGLCGLGRQDGTRGISPNTIA